MAGETGMGKKGEWGVGGGRGGACKNKFDPNFSFIGIRRRHFGVKCR